MPKYSLIIVEGFERSKVFIDEVLPVKLQSILGTLDLNGVEKTDTEPENPESGKIYYNTLTGEYRIYNSETQEWDEFAVVKHIGLPIVSSNFETQEGYPVTGGSTTLDGYKVYSDKYYIFTCSVGTPLALYFPELAASENASYALSFVGLFVAPSDVTGFSFNIYNRVHLDDASAEIEIEAGHVYEFNVLNRICKLTDVTTTVDESIITPGQ
jgi:hypothetical protein